MCVCVYVCFASVFACKVTVGTQAAVLAGLDITMFIEFNPPDNSTWPPSLLFIPRFLKFLYYITIVAAFCSNILVVSQTTALSVLGAGLALRGPDGSMMTATDGLYEHRKSVFTSFGIGLTCTVSSVVVCVWLVLHWEAALICSIMTIYTCRKMQLQYQHVLQRFAFDEGETVDFTDIFEGPAAIHVSNHKQSSSSSQQSSSSSSSQQQQQRFTTTRQRRGPQQPPTMQPMILVDEEQAQDSETQMLMMNGQQEPPLQNTPPTSSGSIITTRRGHQHHPHHAVTLTTV